MNPQGIKKHTYAPRDQAIKCPIGIQDSNGRGVIICYINLAVSLIYRYAFGISKPAVTLGNQHIKRPINIQNRNSEVIKHIDPVPGFIYSYIAGILESAHVPGD